LRIGSALAGEKLRDGQHIAQGFEGLGPTLADRHGDPGQMFRLPAIAVPLPAKLVGQVGGQ